MIINTMKSKKWGIIYKKRVDIFSYSLDTYLFVRNTDTVISRNRMFHDVKKSFENLMSFDSMSYEEFKEFIEQLKLGYFPDVTDLKIIFK